MEYLANRMLVQFHATDNTHDNMFQPHKHGICGGWFNLEWRSEN